MVGTPFSISPYVRSIPDALLSTRCRGAAAGAAGEGSSGILDVDAIFGGWKAAQAQFFADGAIFDQIIEKSY